MKISEDVKQLGEDIMIMDLTLEESDYLLQVIQNIRRGLYRWPRK